MVRWLFILLLLGFALHTAQVEERAALNNYRQNRESWAEWEYLLAKYPDGQGLQTLHALRLGICIKIERGKMTVDEGTAIFEQAAEHCLRKSKRKSVKQRCGKSPYSKQT